MSAADRMTVLPTRHLSYDWAHPKEPANDHVIFSEGHLFLLLHAMFAGSGVIDDEELVTTFRRFGSKIWGHPISALQRRLGCVLEALAGQGATAG